MKTSSSIPTVTGKWHIEVPTNKYLSVPAVFKVWFGKKYLIWKGKSLLQSCKFLAEGIERYRRRKSDIDTDYLYHVCNHIQSARVNKATVEVVDNSFMRTIRGEESINGYGLLVAEQKLLDKAKNDPLCLNNNVEAYVSNWITEAHKQKFEEFMKEREKKKKK